MQRNGKKYYKPVETTSCVKINNKVGAKERRKLHHILARNKELFNLSITNELRSFVLGLSQALCKNTSAAHVFLFAERVQLRRYVHSNENRMCRVGMLVMDIWIGEDFSVRRKRQTRHATQFKCVRI